MPTWPYTEEQTIENNRRRRERYNTDPEYRLKLLRIAKESKLRTGKDYNRRARERYRTDPIYHKERQDKNKKYRCDDPRKFLARNAIAHHRADGQKILVTKEEIIEICKNTNSCPLCNVIFDWSYDGVGPNTPTLDRINNENFLIKDNIQILCWRCNITKGPRTMKEFHDYCKMVAAGAP